MSIFGNQLLLASNRHPFGYNLISLPLLWPEGERRTAGHHHPHTGPSDKGASAKTESSTSQHFHPVIKLNPIGLGNSVVSMSVVLTSRESVGRRRYFLCHGSGPPDLTAVAGAAGSTCPCLKHLFQVRMMGKVLDCLPGWAAGRGWGKMRCLERCGDRRFEQSVNTWELNNNARHQRIKRDPPRC